MELNQSLSVPFTVNDPVSGVDITKDIRLTAIEVGGQPAPYLVPNGDDTFSVIGADETDLTQPVTFKLSAPYEGDDYPLEATTDITIKAATAADRQLTVEFVGDYKGFTVVELNKTFTIDYRAKWKGKYLKAGEAHAIKGGSWSGTVDLVSQEVLPDGITHRVTIKGVALGEHEWFLFVVERLPVVGTPVNGTDQLGCSCYVNVVAAGSTKLYLWIYPKYRSLYVTRNDKQIVFMDLFKGPLKISLSDPAVSIAVSGLNAGPNPFKFSKLNPEGPVFDTILYPSVDTMYYVQYVVKYQGVDASGTNQSAVQYKFFGNTWSTQFKTTPIRPVTANTDMDFVWQAGDINFATYPTNSYTSKRAVIDQGKILGYKLPGVVKAWEQDISGSKLNSISELRTKHAVGWEKSTYNLQGVFLRAPLAALDPVNYGFYQLIKMEDYGYSIAETVTTPVLNNNKVNSKAGSTTYVIVEMRQMRDGVSTLIPGLWTNVKAIGAGTLASTASTSDGKYIIGINGGGSLGDVRVTGKFTPTDTNSEAKDYDIDLVAISDTEFGVVTTPKTVPCEVWDILKDPPFDVLINGVPSTSKIRNIRYQPTTWFIETTKDDPNQWQIVHNVTSVNLTNVTFTFEAQVNGVWATYVGKGVYEIAGYDGVALRVTADYGKGVGVTTEIPVVRASKNRITVWPVYKNQPLKSGFKGSVSVGSWITNASISIVGPAEDGVGVVIEYTAPDTSGAASNSSTLTLTIDDTPGTTINVNKWVGNFTGIYMLEGLYVLPVTLQPSTQQFGKPYTWDSKIYYAGKLLDPADPRLTMEVSNAGALPPYISLVGMKDKIVYFALNTNPGTNGTIVNRLMVTYDDGIAPPETSGYLDLRAGYNGSLGLPITLKPLATPLPNKENIIPVEFWRNEANIGKPTIVHTVSGYSSPNDTNALIGDLELIDDPNDSTRNALKFGSGWTGGKVVLDMVAEFPGLPDPWYVRNNEMTVDGSVVTTASEDLAINGITDSAKVITFALSQERLIDGVTQTYTFADATISNGVTVTGAIQRVDAVSNTAGVFKATFYGKGMEGKGTATFTVTDTDTRVYKVDVVVDATIDSSGFVLTLTPDSASGKKGDRLPFTGTLVLDGVPGRMDDFGLTWTAEPAGYLNLGMSDRNAVHFDIVRSATEKEDVEVFLVVKDRPGHVAKHKVSLEVLPNINVITERPKVKVWDKLSRTPFVVTDDKDIPQSITDLARVPNPNILEVTPVGTYQIVSEVARPAGLLVVTWTYRLTSDPVGTKRTVDITYDVATYDGNQLTFATSGTTAFTWNTQGDFRIIPLWRGNEFKTTVNYIGQGTGGETIVNYTSWSGETGKVKMSVIGISGLNVVKELQGFFIQITGGYPGNANGIVEAMIPLTVYNPGIPFQMGKPKPPSITGRLGDTFSIYADAVYKGNDVTLEGRQIEPCVPSDVMEIIPGSVLGNSFGVRFLKDIDVNSKTTSVQFGFADVWDKRYVATQTLSVTQLTLHPKLTASPGFQTTGSGDMENPVTLQQSVLNPE